VGKREGVGRGGERKEGCIERGENKTKKERGGKAEGEEEGGRKDRSWGVWRRGMRGERKGEQEGVGDEG